MVSKLCLTYIKLCDKIIPNLTGGSDFMNFDLVTSIFLDNKLRKIGIDRNLSIISKQFTYFSIEELSEIESLTIQGIDDIRFLLYLPCLKKLKIYSEDYSNVIAGGSYQDNTLFNTVSDQYSQYSLLSGVLEKPFFLFMYIFCALLQNFIIVLLALR